MTKLHFDPSHQPSAKFEHQLKTQVLQTYYQKEKKMSKIFQNPIVIVGSALAVVALVVVGGMTFLRFGDDSTKDVSIVEPNLQVAKTDPMRQVGTKPSYSTNGGGSATGTGLAGQQSSNPTYTSLSDAAKTVGFSPYAPANPIKNEALTELYSTDGLSGGSEKSLYLSYGTTDAMLYQLIETKAVASDVDPATIPGVKTVPLVVEGKQIKAVINQFWDEKTPKDQVMEGTPRRTISITIGEIAVDISEYGQLEVDDIQTIINNLSQ